ncbi:MAG: SLC13/DASS family transporter, partial [Halobacteriovoraceae bacterium]|nr:SLC13/DASS family transporter [Halobacteriovoraceae bacterium]
ELTSNMASTEMLLPILASIAKAANLNPLSLMVPATLAASCAFMLPAATAPNAIIFGSRKVKIGEMVKVGFIINTISIIIIGLFSLFVIPHILS